MLLAMAFATSPPLSTTSALAQGLEHLEDTPPPPPPFPPSLAHGTGKVLHKREETPCAPGETPFPVQEGAASLA